MQPVVILQNINIMLVVVMCFLGSSLFSCAPCVASPKSCTPKEQWGAKTLIDPDGP